MNYRNYGRLWRVYGRSVFRYGSARKFWNAARTEWAYRRRHVDVPSRPYILFVEPVYICNLRCPLCDREKFASARTIAKGTEDTGRLSLDVFDRVLDEIGDYLFQCQIFGVGEPMLDWPLTRQVIERAHRRRIFTLMSTNATPLTAKTAAEVVGSGLDHVACAIDGVSQEAYARYRVGGRAEQAIGGMRLLAAERDRQRSGIEIEWQYLVHRHNAHEVGEARRIADDLGVTLRCAPIGGVEGDPELQDYWLPPGGEWQDSRVASGRPRNDWHCYWLWRGAVIDSSGRLCRCPGYQTLARMTPAADGVMATYNGPGSQRSRELFSKGKGVPDGPFPAPCDTCSFYRRERGGPYLDKSASASACGGPAPAAPSPLIRLGAGRRRSDDRPAATPAPPPMASGRADAASRTTA